MSEEFRVQDNGSLPNYFSQNPNIIWELGLDPYAITLYMYYRKVAGDHGSCFQKKKTISENLKMSVSVIKNRNNILSQPFEMLGGKPLITIEQEKGEDGNNLPTLIRLVDIWPENIKEISTRFSDDPPSVAKKPTLGRQKTTEQEPIEEYMYCSCFGDGPVGQEKNENYKNKIFYETTNKQHLAIEISELKSHLSQFPQKAIELTILDLHNYKKPINDIRSLSTVICQKKSNQMKKVSKHYETTNKRKNVTRQFNEGCVSEQPKKKPFNPNGRSVLDALIENNIPLGKPRTS